MKVLCLADINSFASLQDALSGKGLPPIQRSVNYEGTNVEHSSCTQFDWILIKNNESLTLRLKELGEILQGLKFSDTFTFSIEKDTRYAETTANFNNDIEEPVVFEYHSPCRNSG